MLTLAEPAPIEDLLRIALDVCPDVPPSADKGAMIAVCSGPLDESRVVDPA